MKVCDSRSKEGPGVAMQQRACGTEVGAKWPILPPLFPEKVA